MLGLGVSEVIIILIIALVVLGPTKLPQVARQVGKGLREFRRAASDLQNTFDEVAREAEREERAAETRKLLNLPAEGEPVGSSGFNQEFDAQGHPIATDAHGHPVATDAHGHPVATDAHGHPVATDAQGHPVATDAQGHPIATDAEGHPLATDASGRPIALDSEGHRIVTAERSAASSAEPGAASLAPDAVASASGSVTSNDAPSLEPPDPRTK